MKKYIDIKPDYTLDKGVDNSSPTAKQNSFTSLTNYIPEQGAITTRKGMSEFDFTDPNALYVPSADSSCIMHLKFEGGVSGFKDCQIQGDEYMVTTAGSSSHIYPDTGRYKVGSSSLHYETSGMPGLGLALMYYRVCADLPALFPGEGRDDIIMSFWFYGVSFADWIFNIIRKDHSGEQGSIFFGFKGTNKFNLTVYDRTCEAIYGYSYNRWYHVGIWSSKTVGNSGFLYYDYITGGQEAVVMSPPRTLTGVDSRTGSLWVGLGNREVENLYIDDFIVLNVVPSTQAAIYAKIRWMRARGL